MRYSSFNVVAILAMIVIVTVHFDSGECVLSKLGGTKRKEQLEKCHKEWKEITERLADYLKHTSVKNINFTYMDGGREELELKKRECESFESKPVKKLAAFKDKIRNRQKS